MTFQNIFLFLSILFLSSCESNDDFVCPDDNACNFGSSNNEGTCLYDDCLGECDGNAVEDECGDCNGDGIDEGKCDCDGNVLDCEDECGGNAIEDECGDCNGDGIDEGKCDCDGISTTFICTI
jgi:hypothetical protein